MTLQEPSSGPEALSEALVFLNFFADLPDPRQAGKAIYPLAEVRLLCLLAVLAGAESFVEIARFGEKKIELLRRFLPFKDGAPSHDQLGDIFATLDATIFTTPSTLSPRRSPPGGFCLARRHRPQCRKCQFCAGK
ncbi:MAG TPA: transposase family protein [Xanthobacteraceae bacterium]|jgi:hypothetical protein|nr:transposase family protein [Xanthobacteraceae bacterium]